MKNFRVEIQFEAFSGADSPKQVKLVKAKNKAAVWDQLPEHLNHGGDPHGDWIVKITEQSSEWVTI